MASQLSSPRTPAAIERSFAGYRAALTRLTVPELLALADRQAAELQRAAQGTIFELLSDWHREALSQPVLSTPPASMGGSARGHADPASQGSSSPPRPPAAPSRPKPHAGRRLATALEHRGRAVNARRERAEGRR